MFRKRNRVSPLNAASLVNEGLWCYGHGNFQGNKISTRSQDTLPRGFTHAPGLGFELEISLTGHSLRSAATCHRDFDTKVKFSWYTTLSTRLRRSSLRVAAKAGEVFPIFCALFSRSEIEFTFPSIARLLRLVVTHVDYSSRLKRTSDRAHLPVSFPLMSSSL